MGWGHGHNAGGREIGYSVEAVCDHPDCGAAINRGMGYACGDAHDDGDGYCDGYFCDEHLALPVPYDGKGFRCESCLDAADAERAVT